MPSHSFTRRDFLAGAAVLATAPLLERHALAAAAGAPASVAPPVVQLSWLGGAAPRVPVPLACGVPWPRGAVRRTAQVLVRNSAGNAMPAQTWPMAYWPDGSVKWTGIAIAADSGTQGVSVTTGSGRAATSGARLTVRESADGIDIDTGVLTARIDRRGASLVTWLRVAGRDVARHGRLVALREDRSQYGVQGVLREEVFTSSIGKVTVEQGGPVRAVVHIEGTHGNATRQWLPFSVRLYFTAGMATVRMVHSFVFDGDQATDFIKGLGLAFSVPFREETQNRHIRFATGGRNMFSEPVLMAPGYQPRVMKHAVAYQRAQIRGERMPNLADLPDKSRNSILGTATWDSFKLRQLSADGWDLFKRTNADSAWLRVTGGTRAGGLAFLGDVSGGLAIGLKRFWQKFPASLEISGAAGMAGELRVWFWSPDAEPMDMRHYDTVAHSPEVTYEDARAATRAKAYGCANTAELTLWATPDTPDAATLEAMAATSDAPPLLICSPQHYYATQTLGVWSLPGTPLPGVSAAELAASETQLDRAFAFFDGEIERRRWYGFWDYGDYRRTYDPVRHQWMYDIGGHGWNATELMPNVWLWFAFLRSGRADLFRAAEDMTRNTSEVDVYHIGPFAGAGSRHNVSHWGDGAKEPRINVAFLKRFHYYLTTDERMGDLLREPLDVVEKTVGLYLNDTSSEGPEIAIRLSPDWQTFASHWFTEWERTGEKKYRDFCLAGMESLGAMSQQAFDDGSFYFDTASKRLRPKGVNSNGHFLFLFGGDQILYELTTQIPCPAFEQAWDRNLANYVLPRQANGYSDSRMMAYVAMTTGRRDIEQRAVVLFRELLKTGRDYFGATLTKADGPGVVHAVLELPERVPFVRKTETPEAAQWALNIMTAPEWLRRYHARAATQQ